MRMKSHILLHPLLAKANTTFMTPLAIMKALNKKTSTTSVGPGQNTATNPKAIAAKPLTSSVHHKTLISCLTACPRSG
jgi:hypothetical protein